MSSGHRICRESRIWAGAKLAKSGKFLKNTGPTTGSFSRHYYSTIFAFSQIGGKIWLARFGKFCRLCLVAFWRYGGRMKTPNQLSREAIESFKAIYQEEFGETLTDDEVQEIAMRLLRFFGILNKDK